MAKSLWGIFPLRFQLALLRLVVSGIAGNRVVAGPFSGMAYASGSTDDSYYARLVGTYEFELSGVVMRLCGGAFTTVVNVGAGEGYYAVGFATKLASCGVIAYEAKHEGRVLISEMARINGVAERVVVRGV